MTSVVSGEGKFTQNITQNKAKKVQNSALGTIASVGVGIGGNTLLKNYGSKFFANKFLKLNNELSQDSIDILKKATDEACIKSGVKEKGFELLRIDNNNIAYATEKMKDSFEDVYKKLKIPMNKKIDLALDHVSSTYTNTVKTGRNAFCNFRGKQIYLPKNKLSMAGFHEIGHAMNSMQGITKFLQKIRGPLTLLPVVLTLFGAFTKKSEAKDGQELSKGAKAKNFVRKNAGIFSFLAMTPMLAEEGLASVKGGKLAKELLSPELAKKVSKNNKLAWCTYLCAALAAGVGTWAAVKTKDVIQNKKNRKAEPEAQIN